MSGGKKFIFKGNILEKLASVLGCRASGSSTEGEDVDRKTKALTKICKKDKRLTDAVNDCNNLLDKIHDLMSEADREAESERSDQAVMSKSI